MSRNVYVQMSKLHNVKGRLYYISSSAKQEHLYATYDTVDRSFWTKLARENQNDFRKSGTDGKCIEARELIIALPEKFVEYEPNELLRSYTESFKEKYGVECSAALHHNKKMTNYHIHLIFSERKMLTEPEIKIASRNMYYDENGKKVRTKKEVLDENEQLRKGCKVIKKGEIYEEKLFDKKDPLFKQKHYLDEVKQFYVEKMNRNLNDENNKMKVFDRNGPYLPMQKIGKNNPKEKLIKQNNNQRLKWNKKVSNAIFMRIPVAFLIELKQTEVMEPIRNSIRDYGSVPDKFMQILDRALTTLSRVISRFVKQGLTSRMKPNTAEFTALVVSCRPREDVKKRDSWVR